MKNEIRRYEIEMGIEKLQMNIVLTKDEIRSIVGKREAEEREEKERVEVDLRKVFGEKAGLEREMEEVRVGSHAEKQALLTAHHQ